MEKIVVMGGAGHIGLPQGLLLADAGFEVCLHDLNEEALKRIAGGIIPFLEEGAEAVLGRVLPSGHLSFSADPACISGSDSVI